VRRLDAKPAFDDVRELRDRARAFAQMAGEARDPVVVVELRRLAQEYDRHADALVRQRAAPPPRERATSGD
jgi:hypothetical protein